MTANAKEDEETRRHACRVWKAPIVLPPVWSEATATCWETPASCAAPRGRNGDTRVSSLELRASLSLASSLHLPGAHSVLVVASAHPDPRRIRNSPAGTADSGLRAQAPAVFAPTELNGR